MIIRLRLTAKKDLARRNRYYAQIDLELAERFLQAFMATSERIVASPKLGSLWRRPNNRPPLRYQPVEGFPMVLIFYRENIDELMISRILHARQNISKILSPKR